MPSPVVVEPEATVTSVPRLVIAAPQGRSGKTTVALGLGAALAGRGLAVQPFKKGPDYIDPSWLSGAAGRTCRTLDPFFLVSPEAMQRALLKGGRDADVCLIEGNHGLYDSLDEDGAGSTAAVARCLQAPVILVVNTARMSRSAAAMVHGYQTFEPDVRLAAVVLNNVAGSRHQTKLRQAIERHCHIPVVGAIPRRESLTIPDRHLGLIPRAEQDGLLPAIQACRDAAEQYLDLEAILKIARTAPPLPVADRAVVSSDPAATAQNTVRVGVIRDRAFTFYYPENLEALVEAGAELVFIDALQDPHLPEIEALYIGGGFPEMFLDELSANESLRQEIRAGIEAGLPVYAECGGLMYLTRRIVWGHRSAAMVGALPCQVELIDRPQGHGYVLGEAVGDNPFLPVGASLRGHEFHHSRLLDWRGELPTAYALARGQGLGAGRDGLVYRNVLATYTHLHAAGSPGWAAGLVGRARAYRKGKNDATV
ncbi:MAG: cobyrinate a,c-diamide synthase [Chloroflexota bacterium]